MSSEDSCEVVEDNIKTPTSIPPAQKKSLSSKPFHFSPLSTRSRKILSPNSSFPFSPVSDVSTSSDMSDSATPTSTPGM